MPAGLPPPMTEYSTDVPSSPMATLSIAPSAARMPHLIPAPSNAGPAEQAHATIQSALPMTISPFVPISMNRKTSSPITRQLGAEQARGDIAAYIAAHAGSAGDQGVGMNVQSHFAGAELRDRVDRRHIGRLANVALAAARAAGGSWSYCRPRRQLESRCASIAFASVICRTSALMVSSTRARSSSQPLGSAGIVDARDDVGSASDLQVVGGLGRQQPAILQIDQLYRDRGGADIDRQPQGAGRDMAGLHLIDLQPRPRLLDCQREFSPGSANRSRQLS